MVEVFVSRKNMRSQNMSSRCDPQVVLAHSISCLETISINSGIGLKDFWLVYGDTVK